MGIIWWYYDYCGVRLYYYGNNTIIIVILWENYGTIIKWNSELYVVKLMNSPIPLT